MGYYPPERQSSLRARDRTRRRPPMATPQATPRADSPPAAQPTVPSRPVVPPPVVGRTVERQERVEARRARINRNAPTISNRLGVLLRDGWWYFSRNLYVLPGIIAAVVVVFLLFVGARVTQARIFPNVWAMGVNLDNKTVDEAALALRQVWDRAIRIELQDLDRVWSATPTEMGLILDAEATAEAARAAGMSGIPFGVVIQPVVTVDYLLAQDYFLDLTQTTQVMPYNAGYRWQDDRLIGIPGSDGRFLDVARTMERLQANPSNVVQQRRLDLIMTPMPPEISDPMPYYNDVLAFTNQQFIIQAYDPFIDQIYTWTTDRDTLTTWIEAGQRGITLRVETFIPFIEAKSAEVNAPDPLRYIEQNDTILKMREAIQTNKSRIDLRIRYRTSRHQVVPGDSGYRIGSKTGIPFYQISLANPARDWDIPLVVGEYINLPSRDITVPIDPVPGKRIIVDLVTQSLMAFENGQPVFSWKISSGMVDAPTAAGIFQILSHAEVAYGSSYTLCGNTGCSQWTMYWFMGIYEVIPGLVNGFHGAVLLPNGTYLGGGGVGRPATFGCIMSENSNGELLFHWADRGTIVEIVGREFQPMSEIGRQATAMMRAAAGMSTGT